MKVFFDMSFDQGCWPGPLQEKNAAGGEIWVGPMGLLDILETMTGLRGPKLPPALRAAALVPAIRSIEGFWSQSASIDPFGTARKILEWRDLLWLYGWRGEPCSPRLKEIARVTADNLPGIPDRLMKVGQSLGKANNDIAEITLFEPVEDLPPAWKHLVLALEQTGTHYMIRDIVPVRSTGDLANSREAPFSPTGDGSLQLLRPLTHGAAAQEAAAWLSDLGDQDQTVIIGPDSVLDEALHRFGLPTSGAGIPLYDNALLQILPLILEMAWEPPDPQRALELLILPVSPIPKGIAFRLIRALQKFPAVGSEAWNEALEKGLQTLEDASRRNELAKRLEAIFSSRLRTSLYPAREILARIDLIRTWARGHMVYETNDLDWNPLIAQLENAQRLVSLSGLQSFTASQIKRMVHDITEESGSTSLYENQAGLRHVQSPECLVDQAANIVWWSFHRDAVHPLAADPFSESERKALKEKGVNLPDPGQQSLRNAHRWQRPLFLAEKNLILVCPEQSLSGEEQYPHPLWDELIGRIPPGNNGSILENPEIISLVKPRRERRKGLPLPQAEPNWTIQPELLSKRDRESPQSLSSLLSCPLQWVLTYVGGLSGGLAATLAEPAELEGWFIHEILTRTLKQGKQSPEAAVQTAGELFDREGPYLAARFFLPGFDDLRAQVRKSTENAAELLFRMIKKAHYDFRTPDEPYELKLPSLGYTLEGRPDLVLEPTSAVLDFKRGGVTYRQKEIENGTSIQLAVYGRLLQGIEKKPFPPAAYFMLKAGRIITTEPQAFPDSMPLDGISLDETWKAVKEAYHSIWTELSHGDIRAPGNEADPLTESAIIDGRLCLAPCKFCNLDILCGQAFSEGS